MGESFLERRGLDLGALDHAGDTTQFRVHTGCHHHGFATAVGGGGAHENHVQAIGEGHIFLRKRVGRLLDRFRLSCQRGFLHTQPGGHYEAGVGRDQVARFQEHHVSGGEICGRDLSDSSVPAHPHYRRRQLPQSAHGLLGLVLLTEAQEAVEDNDGHNGDGVF